ncbi:MAG: MBL fold metallo-hydrolase [Nitrospiraceae bacterium]|nr:MAG: MBL fold metallo-hydrolase [Nitrospiraceae bacterium]
MGPFIRSAVSTVIIFLFTVSCASTAEEGTPEHHRDGNFRNVYLQEDHGFFEFVKWRWERLWKEIPSADSYSFPLAKNDPPFLRSNHNHTTLTWIGHATLLIQMHGNNILTDPQFSERASPVQWAGPRRVVPPGIAMEDLPDIDIVIISHDHYDSLDVNTVRGLHARTGGDKTKFFVPLGLKAWFQKLEITNVVEMDWWDEQEAGSLKVIAVPMQHWGKRTPFNRNDHLWASWVIIADDFRFYFGGDTGFSSHFKETGDRFGPFDLAALPIGAYEPRWFMRNHHINPEEAVQGHIALRSKKSVAMHWGTFMLTDEPLDEPPVRLRKALKDASVPEEAFRVLQHGETIIIEHDKQNETD